MIEIKITISGDPTPKARPRVTKRGITYNPQKKISDDVRLQVKAQYGDDPIEGAVGVLMEFHMPIPKSYSKKKKQLIETGKIFHTKKPDIDNLEKFILDCMNGIVFKDDSQIVQTYARKQYSSNPRTEVEIIDTKA